MEVYIYAADYLCEDCAEAQRKHLDEAFAENGAAPGTDEDDSDRYPQGPYPDGGGEADSPQHCGQCGVFLENPLTGEGYAYLREEAACYIAADDDGEIDVELMAQRAQDDWNARIDPLPATHPAKKFDEAPVAQWVRYYPEAWEPGNGYEGRG